MLGDNIRENREKLGINQVELAKLMGVSKQTVSNWENDNRIPPTQTLDKLANIFNVTTDSLLGRNTVLQSDTRVDIENDEDYAVAKEISKLDAEDKEFIKQMIKKLNKNKQEK
jgi:transcriptional regulator with XRE-family HTH domain